MITELEAQIAEQPKLMSEIYIKVSVSYKRMSKAKDLHSRTVIQSSINLDLGRANELSDKLEVLKKEGLKYWETNRNSPDKNKAPYD